MLYTGQFSRNIFLFIRFRFHPAVVVSLGQWRRAVVLEATMAHIIKITCI